MSEFEAVKASVAKHALKLIKKKMIVGLGTGSTANVFIKELAKLNNIKALGITGVATSKSTSQLAKELGIFLVDINEVSELDIVFDGADEVDDSLNLIKGGGGALLQEKIVAMSSRKMIVLVDDTKRVTCLGKYPLPIEIVRFGSSKTLILLEEYFKDKFPNASAPCLRKRNGKIFVTDENHFIVDVQLKKIINPKVVNIELNAITGVVETGLFPEMANSVITGKRDGSIVIEKRGV